MLYEVVSPRKALFLPEGEYCMGYKISLSNKPLHGLAVERQKGVISTLKTAGFGRAKGPKARDLVSCQGSLNRRRDNASARADAEKRAGAGYYRYG
jgi:hypothetical protein